MPFHRIDELTFIGPGIRFRHRIEPIHLELVPDHLAMRGTGTCITDGPLIVTPCTCNKYWDSDDPSLVIPEGLIWSGRIFPIIPGVNEHPDFSNELNIITATDAACGNGFPP